MFRTSITRCYRLLVHHVTSYTSHCQILSKCWCSMKHTSYFPWIDSPCGFGVERQTKAGSLLCNQKKESVRQPQCVIVSCVSDFSQQWATTCLLCCILHRQNHTRLTFSTFSPLTTQILIIGVISSHIPLSSFPCSGLNFTILNLKVTCKCDCMWPILQFPHL